MKQKELQLLSEQSEKLTTASPQREACQRCGLFKNCQTPFMNPYVPAQWGEDEKVLLVGEAPGEHEDEVSHRPFTGPAGILLGRLWDESGYHDYNIALVHSVRCHPYDNAKPTMVQIRACRPFLLRVIERTDPDRVVACGGIALKALSNNGSLTNVTENRGRPFVIPPLDIKAEATYHPASVLHGNIEHEARILEDLQRDTMPKLEWPRVSERSETDEIMGFDTEFVEPGPTLDPPVKKRLPLILALSDGESAKSYLAHDKDLPTIFRGIKKLVAHNAPCDIDTLIQLGICKETWAQGRDLRDSLWLTRLADENRGKGGYRLENLLLSLYNTPGWKHKTEQYGFDPRTWPPEFMHERCRLDAWASYHIANHYLPDKDGSVDKACGQLTLQHRMGMTLQRIYHTGVYIDTGFLSTFQRTVSKSLNQSGTYLEERAKQLNMKEFSPGNKNHIRALVYEYLKIPATNFTKKGIPSAGKLFLKEHKASYPEIEHILNYGKYDKIRSTYIESITARLTDAHVPEVNGLPVKWMPVRINPLGTRTLRRSSGADQFDPASEENGQNFQNWTKAVRPLVTSRFTDGLIVDNDYHKLEAILQGWLADEQQMVDYFLHSPNGYIEIGKKLFKKEVKEDTPDYRLVKSLLLGINYNMDSWTLAKNLWRMAEIKLNENWYRHLEETEDLYLKYFKLFPKLRKYIKACINEAMTTGEVVMSLGYKRRLPCPPEPSERDKEAHARWRQLVKHIKNEAANCKAQHLASLITGSAMIDVEARLLQASHLTYVQYHDMLMHQQWPCMPLLTNEVHDDLVYDMPKAKRTQNLALIKETMEHLPTLRRLMPELPDIIRVDQKGGSSWGKY